MARRTSMRLVVVAAAMVTVTACGGSTGSSGTPIEAGAGSETPTSAIGAEGTSTTGTGATTTGAQARKAPAPGATTTSKGTALAPSTPGITSGPTSAPGPDTTGSSPEPTTPPTEAAATTTTAARATTTTVRARPRVKLPTGGPRGPVEPPGTPAYELLTQGVSGCQTLFDTIKAEWENPQLRASVAMTYLYRGASEACLLRWPEAKADFDRLQALNLPAFPGTCPDEQSGARDCGRCLQVVLQWLTAQLAAHKADPGYAPVYVAADSTSPSPCATGGTTTTVKR